MSRRAEYWWAIGSKAIVSGRAFVVHRPPRRPIAWLGRGWTDLLGGRRG